ncbi:MAG TPA: TolC family protein [Flavisolibacter sp.]|jgi:outer membrane protein|nr:TolC family protein [Flavisolibacter sp.]
MSTFKFLKWSIGVVVLVFGNIASAQDTLTVEKAIATALNNNYDILLSRQDSASVAISNEYRNAVFLPTLNANSTVLFNNNAQRSKFASGKDTTRTGIHTSNLNASLNLNWTLFDGFRMFIARDRLDVATIRGSLVIKNQVVNTVSDVIKTYYDIVRQKQLLKNIQEQMTLSADRLRLAQYKLDIGVGIKPDVLQAQIDYNTQHAAQINQLSVIDQRKHDLNRLMNVPQTVDYEVIDTILVTSDLVLGNLMNGIEESSPALRLVRTEIDLAHLDVREAKALRFPTVGFTSAYSFARNTNNSVVNPVAQALFNQNRGFNYGFTASIPIFNRFTAKQQMRQAELAVNYSQLQLENQQSIVNTNILNNYRSYVAQREIVGVNDSSVVLARENLSIERERYRLGATTFIELRQAEENLANAITNSITTRYNLKVAETELLRLRGDLVR